MKILNSMTANTLFLLGLLLALQLSADLPDPWRPVFIVFGGVIALHGLEWRIRLLIDEKRRELANQLEVPGES